MYWYNAIGLAYRDVTINSFSMDIVISIYTTFLHGLVKVHFRPMQFIVYNQVLPIPMPCLASAIADRAARSLTIAISA